MAVKKRPRARWTDALSGAVASARSRIRRAPFASPAAIAVSACAIRAGASPGSAGRVEVPRDPAQAAASAIRTSAAGAASGRRSATEQPPLLEARVALARDHDVVEEVDPEDSSGFEEAPRDREILLARRGISRGVVVRQNDARGRQGDGGQVDLARMDDARVQAPDRD